MKLQQAKWANFDNAQSKLISFEGPLPIQMQHSDGTALPLVLDESREQKFGADVIRFAAGHGVGLHTHPGAHILLVTKGRGILTYFKERHEMFAGMIYLVPPNVPHAIEAHSELVLVAIGNDHKSAASTERLTLVPTA